MFLGGPISGRAHQVAILGSLLLLTFILYLIRKGHLKAGYAILWFFITIATFAISTFDTVLYSFSDIIGVYYAPSAIFSILIVGLILIVIHFSVLLSKHEKQIKKLAQENGILKNKIEKIKGGVK